MNAAAARELGGQPRRGWRGTADRSSSRPTRTCRRNCWMPSVRLQGRASCWSARRIQRRGDGLRRPLHRDRGRRRDARRGTLTGRPVALFELPRWYDDLPRGEAAGARPCCAFSAARPTAARRCSSISRDASWTGSLHAACSIRPRDLEALLPLARSARPHWFGLAPRRRLRHRGRSTICPAWSLGCTGCCPRSRKLAERGLPSLPSDRC